MRNGADLAFEGQLYAALERAVFREFPDTEVRETRSQIAFAHKGRPFAYAWLPIRKGIAGRPERYIIVSFVLRRRLISPRVLEATPVKGRANAAGRCMHHVLFSKTDDIDGQLLEWLREARDTEWG